MAKSPSKNKTPFPERCQGSVLPRRMGLWLEMMGSFHKTRDEETKAISFSCYIVHFVSPTRDNSEVFKFLCFISLVLFYVSYHSGFFFGVVGYWGLNPGLCTC